MPTTNAPSVRIANATGISVADKAFLQIVYGCILINLYSQKPTVQAPSSVTLRLTNCAGCFSSPNTQYQLGQANAQQITYLSQFANSATGLQNLIKNVLYQVLVSKDYNLPPVKMFFSNFQTLQDIQITLFNHIPSIYMSQLQNVANIASENALYDIRNFDCNINGPLAINSATIVNSFADQITAAITISANRCITAAKNFPFFLYDSDNNIILHPLGKNSAQMTSSIGSFCVLNNSNSIIDAITFEIVGETVRAVQVTAINSIGAPLQSPVTYTTQNVFHTFSVNPGQGYAIKVYLTTNTPSTIYVTGMTTSYLTPPAKTVVKNTYIPPLPNLSFLIKWKGTSLYLGADGYLVPKINATIFTYDNVKNIISPPVLTASDTFLNATGTPVSFQILSYGDSALLANAGQSSGSYAYTFEQNSVYFDPNWVAPFSYINNNVASALTSQSDIFAFDYEYVLISNSSNTNNTSNKLIVNSSFLSYSYPASNSTSVSGDIFMGAGSNYQGYYATNISKDTISLLAIQVQSVTGNFEDSISIFYAQNSQPVYSKPITQIQQLGNSLVNVSIPPGTQFYVSYPGGGNSISVKPYAAHTASNILYANEYLTSGSVKYDPTQGFFVSSGDAFWDSTNSYFMVLMNGDLCFGSKTAGIIYSSNPITNGTGNFVVLTNDGKLSIIDKTGSSLWASNNIPALNTNFTLQENGDYIIFNGTTPLWSQNGIVPNTNSIPPVPNPTPPVPAGTFPRTGRKFVVASAFTGQYVCDNGIMSSDISKAKIFTFNLPLQQTNELLQTANTSSETNLSLGPTNLMINFNGIDTLVGGTYNQSNGLVYYAISFGFPSWTAWNFSTIGYDVSDSLSSYYNNYAVVLYYV